MSASNDLKKLESYFDRLWPLCRSIMGPGYRESLKILSELIPLSPLTFESGSKVFDWTVPLEWQPREAYFIGPDKKRYADFSKNNLHLLNYSTPFKGRMTFEELDKHLYSLPEQPDAIPYLTTYYKERWGFCLSHRERQNLPRGEYDVIVDTELKPGQLVVGELVLPGATQDEILFSTYLCHPSMANNELSGPLAMALLYERISKLDKRHWTYRFVVSAETIGTLCYLSKRGDELKRNVRAGYQMTCLGDAGPFTYKRSKQLNSMADWAALRVLNSHPHKVIDFDPADGSDERQYCSPGFNLPLGSLMRTVYAQYPEYHTSLDNKSFIRFDKLLETVEVYFEIAKLLERNPIYVNLNSHGEPQLGKRGLYPNLGGQKEIENEVRAIMWTLSFCDGHHGLLQIADRAGLPETAIFGAAEKLKKSGLLQP